MSDAGVNALQPLMCGLPYSPTSVVDYGIGIEFKAGRGRTAVTGTGLPEHSCTSACWLCLDLAYRESEPKYAVQSLRSIDKTGA